MNGRLKVPAQQTTSMKQPTNHTNWQIWWQLLRPVTLTASIIPVLIGTALAAHSGPVHMGLFTAMLTASVLIQAATNMFNEYYDFKRGLDTEDSVGIGGTIVRYGVAPRVVLTLGIIFYAIAVLLGVYICVNSSWWIAVIGSICMLAGYLYTGGPYPIAYTPFGELAAGFFMGIGIILLTFYIQSGEVTLESLLISIPIAILIGAILMANNIRDLDGDEERGRQTLAILLGRQRAIYFLSGMFASAYLWTIGLVIFAGCTPWLLLVIFSVPKSVQAVKRFQGQTEPIKMMPAMKATAGLNTLFGVLFSIGLLVHYWLP